MRNAFRENKKSFFRFREDSENHCQQKAVKQALKVSTIGTIFMREKNKKKEDGYEQKNDITGILCDSLA